MTIMQIIGSIIFTVAIFTPLLIVGYYYVYLDIKNALTEYVKKNHKNTVKR